MKIEDMRIGGMYVRDGKVAACSGLSVDYGYEEASCGGCWWPCADYRPATARDLWPQARALYTSPRQAPEDERPAGFGEGGPGVPLLPRPGTPQPRGPQVGDKVDRWSEVPGSCIVLDTDCDPWQFRASREHRLVGRGPCGPGGWLRCPTPDDREELALTPLIIVALNIADSATPEDVRCMVAEFHRARAK